jgi:RNA polymerase sigma factor (sigma-70 family)
VDPRLGPPRGDAGSRLGLVTTAPRNRTDGDESFETLASSNGCGPAESWLSLQHPSIWPSRVRFEELYQQYAAQVFTWARRYAHGRSAWAEDLTHDVFVRAWEQRDQLREEDVKGWLFRVTQNRAFTLLRREGSLAHRLKQTLSWGWHSEQPTTPEDALDQLQTTRAASAALQQLPGQERVVLCLKLLDGLSQREIAELLSLSEGYVSKLVTRATARLTAQGWKVHSDGA